MRDPWWCDDSGGRTVVLPFGLNGSSADLCQLSDTSQGAEPLPLVCSFGVELVDDPIASDPRVQIDLSWGNPRALQTATIDAGQTISLATSYLRARAFTHACAAGFHGSARVTMNVTRSGSSPRSLPRFTGELIAAVGAAATVGPFQIPRWARRLYLGLSADRRAAADNVLVNWFLPSPVAFPVPIVTDFLGAQQVGEAWAVVPHNAGFWSVTNGALVTNVTPVWELAL